MVFFKPNDVKDMSFMTFKYPARDDDRWMFIPAVNMVKRIAAQDKRSSFVGSDFTYEDVSGHDIEDDQHAVEREQKVGERDCYVVKSTPKAGAADFGHKLTWVDKANYLPLKEEHETQLFGAVEGVLASQRQFLEESKHEAIRAL